MKEIQIGDNKGVALVDDDMYDFLTQWKWYLDDCGYAFRMESRKIIRMHRAIVNAPQGLQVDHVNHIPLDNRKSNLRICTLAENRRNQSRPKGQSQYRGVLPVPNGKWRASIKVNGKKIHLGHFSSELEAAIARDQATRRYHGSFGILNFPD